jgi:hypothetical protein
MGSALHGPIREGVDEVMNVDAAFFVAASGWMLLIFLGFIIWGYRDGQFKDMKDVKFELWKEDEQ